VILTTLPLLVAIKVAAEELSRQRPE